MSQEFLPAPSPDAAGAFRPLLTPQQEGFARDFVDCRNAPRAYRFNYDAAGTMTNRAIWVAARTVLALPQVRDRIRELENEAASDVIARRSALLQRLSDMVEADPREIVRKVSYNCRRCHGMAGKYQWRDEAELAEATQRYETALEAWTTWVPPSKGSNRRDRGPRPTAPDPMGGFDFDAFAAPSPTCPHCMGQGIQQVIITDFDKLDNKTRLLLKSVKQDKDGVITVELHEPLTALKMLSEALGMLKEGASQPERPGDGKRIDSAASAEEAEQTYLAMLGAPK